jgi:hypothetical protein
VYALVDPRDGRWRYIGKSCSGLRRPKLHSCPSHYRTKTHKNNWIRSLARSGLRPGVLVLEEFDNPQELGEAECEWIAEARRVGVDLTNETCGGEGAVGRRVSRATRLKMSQALKGPKNPWYGRSNNRAGVSHRSESNVKNSRAHGGGALVDSLGRIFLTQKEASRATGIPQSTICRQLRGAKPRTSRTIFSYIES